MNYLNTSICFIIICSIAALLGIFIPLILTEYLVNHPSSTFLNDVRESAYSQHHLSKRREGVACSPRL